MEVTVRVEVHYWAPAGAVLGDVLRLLRTRMWAAFMTRHVAPRLEKVSPVDNAVLESLNRQWRAQENASQNPVECAICMDDEEENDHTGRRRPTNSGVQLPCAHNFHRRCIHSWLELQSTCPICRWQFPKEFAGKFVVRRLRSTTVIPDGLNNWPRNQLPDAPVGGHSVRIAVCLALEKASTTSYQGPCEVTALLMDEASGEVFGGVDSSRNCRLASARFATVEESKFDDAASSRVVASETGRKRHRFRRQEGGPDKRQRVGE